MLRVERALEHLRSIPDPLVRIRTCDATADDARAVQGRIAEVRRQAIYEATLQPGETGESIAAALGLSAKAVSSAIAEFRKHDLELFRRALSMYESELSDTTVSERELSMARGTRDVLHAAKVVLRAHSGRVLRRETAESYEILTAAAERARQLAVPGRVDVERPFWDLRTLADTAPDYSRTPPILLELTRALNALPGIRALGSVDSFNSAPSYWSLHWQVMPAEPYATVAAAGPSREGWLSAEWLVWFFNDLRRGDYDVRVDVWSAAPFINEPGESMGMFVVANRGDEAERLPLEPHRALEALRSAWDETGFQAVTWQEATA